MADVDIDPFGEHDRTEEPSDENAPLDPVTPVVTLELEEILRNGKRRSS